MDADGSHDPRDLPRLLAALRTADVAIGSRYVAGSVVGGQRRRRLLDRLGSWYAQRVLALPVTDVSSGFRCYRRSSLRAITAEPLTTGDYGVQAELTQRCVSARCRIAELPVSVRAPAAPSRRSLSKSRIVPFLGVGVVGALTGYATLIALVEAADLSPHLAFLVSSVVSFETNFLLNDRFTWADRRDGSSRWRRRLKFHAGRWLTYVPGQLIFSLLVVAGVGYLAATTLAITVVSLANYVIGDRWVFGRKRPPSRAGAPYATTDHAVQLELPPVSVVIPVRDSGATLRQTVHSVLKQRYDGSVEVILVGSANDSSWSSVRAEIDDGSVIAYELDVEAPGRDTTAKRTLGFDHASGRVLCSIDSDTRMPADWIATAVSHLHAGWDGVAGPYVSLDRTFWGDFVDRNRLGSKTPRMETEYVFDASTLGQRGHKPPVTGSVAFTGEVYAAIGGFDKDFVYTYDDYEYFQRVAAGGFRILCTPDLGIGVHHRRGFRQLVKEYWESGAGCAQFVRKFPRSRFSIVRVRQLVVVAAGCVTAALFPVHALAAIAGGAAVLGVAAVRMDGRLRAFLYPPITLALGLVFAAAMAFRLGAGVVHRPQTRVGAHRRRFAGGEIACTGACENVRMLDIGDDLADDLAPAAATS
jgi:putative flippase GtrA/glycosyltransferase involved in cell wall biosynthesis